MSVVFGDSNILQIADFDPLFAKLLIGRRRGWSLSMIIFAEYTYFSYLEVLKICQGHSPLHLLIELVFGIAGWALQADLDLERSQISKLTWMRIN